MPRPGLLSLVRNSLPMADPPCGLRPHASASISTMVDFPEPFSPTSTVTPGGSSRPSHSICSTAGTVAGHCEVSTGLSGSRRIKRTARPSAAHSGLLPLPIRQSCRLRRAERLTRRTRWRSSEARRTSPAVFACTSTGHLYPSSCPGVTDGLGARWRRPSNCQAPGNGGAFALSPFTSS